MEAKTIEDIENQTVRRLLWDNKVPETSAETRAAAAPGPVPAGSAVGFLAKSQVSSSLPCQTERFEQHQDGPGCLKSLGRIRTKWQTHRGGVHP